MTKKRNQSGKFKYDVAISYASEDIEIAGEIASLLDKKGIRVFYDKSCKVDLWGKSLSAWLSNTYSKSSRFVLVLISCHYPVKDWANFEFSIARDEEKKRKEVFILPLRLDNTKIPGLPSDKVYLDFKKEDVSGVVNCLIQKLKAVASEKIPEDIFREAYKEWKISGFLPGETKVDYFLENLTEIKFDNDTCEFLLRSITGFKPNLREKLKLINSETIFNAAILLLGKENEWNIRWQGIRYSVFANPKKSEPYLWNIYINKNEDLNLRSEAFERLWNCENNRGMDESYFIALKESEWKLRKAAIKNIGYGKLRKNTSEVLADALRDKRKEVRTEAACAIVRFKLDDLTSNLVEAFENERTRKGRNTFLYCLWNFKNHPNAKEFRKKYELPKWFDKTPDTQFMLDIMEDIL